jgi:hypothetical protein
MLMKIYLSSRIRHIIKLYLLSHFNGSEFGLVDELLERKKDSNQNENFLIIQSPHEVPQIFLIRREDEED